MIESTYFSPVFWNWLRFKTGPNLLGWGGKPFLRNNWITSLVPPIVYFNFKNLKDADSTSSHYNAFCMIQQIFSQFFQVFFDICVVRFQYILCTPFRSTFTLFRGSFLPYLKFAQIKKGGLNFLRGTNCAEQLNYLSPLLYFNLIFKIWMHSSYMHFFNAL